MNFGKAPDYLKAAALEPFDLMEEPTPDGVPAGGFFLPFNPAETTEVRPIKEPTLDASDELEGLIQKAFAKTHEILDLSLGDAEDKEFATLLRVQMTAVQTVLNTQVRVDEQRLRRKQSDNLPKLLEALARHDRARRADTARLVNP